LWYPVLNTYERGKTMPFILILGLLLGLSTGADARLSCDELEELAASLDELAEAMTEIDEIGVNSALDGALGDVTDALAVVAAVENDARLTRWIADLNLAWEEMEREDFEDSLDDIIDRLDELGERDCSGW
jgi:Asp-tRNA(Asn)/Glu-tRNA(Gln) amidotransferase C subunit